MSEFEDEGAKKNGQVLNMEEAKKKIQDPNAALAANKKAPLPDKSKIKKMDVYKVIVHMMNGGKGRYAAFPKKYHIKRDDPGEHSYLLEMDGQVLRYVSTRHISDHIVRYAESFQHKDFDLTYENAKTCLDYWASLKPDIEGEIAPVRQKSEAGYTFHRLPFDFAAGETPLFDELMSRTTNANALQSWIGSLFDPDSDRQQYVWIYGQGKNGKGTLARFLTNALKSAVRWDQVPPHNKGNYHVDKFWTSGFLGKRLVIFGDCNDYGFPVSGLFKSLSGGDHQRVEEKNRPSRSEPLQAKFLFLSNDTPMVSSQKADMRRAIFCHMSEIVNDVGPVYEKLLWDEAAHILHKCIMSYQLDMEFSNGVIPVDTEALEAIASQTEEPMETTFAENFEVCDDPTKWVAPMAMQRILRDCGMVSNSQQHRFLRFMSEKYGVVKKRINKNKCKDREWRYAGIRELSTDEVDFSKHKHIKPGPRWP